jgi:prepilin-type N-terminal cleavage/methylation domain-containing protein
VFKGKKGFTLIELLVVIGILGILAIGLLAAIDPFEQLKKGRDTNLRNVAVEYVNAATRYYATHGTLPWGIGALATATLGSHWGAASDYTEMLIVEGELKDGFKDGLGTANADLIFLTGDDDPLQAILCFDPDSKSLSADATTQYDNAGAIVGTCPDPATACFWCAR